jgi:integrase
MLVFFRRHSQKCSAGAKQHDRSVRKCKCPLYAEGRIGPTENVKESLKTRNWEQAARQVMEAEARGWWKVSPDQEKKNAKTITELLEAFLADAASERGRGLRSSTLSKYHTLRGRLFAFAKSKGIQYVTDLTPEHIRGFRDTWKMSARSAANELNRVRCVLKFALENEWIEKNPAMMVKPPKAEKGTSYEKAPFSPEEMERILAAAEADPEMKTLILVMRWTGLRISDASFLRPEQIVEGEIRLATRKTGSHVSIALREEVLARLQAMPVHHNGYWFVTGSTKLETVTDLMRRRIKKIFKAADIKKGQCHAFRHTFATDLIARGMPTHLVSKLLSHTSVSITERFYIHAIESVKKNLAAEFKKTWEQDDFLKVA